LKPPKYLIMKKITFSIIFICLFLKSYSQLTLDFTDYTYGSQNKTYFFNTESASYHYAISNLYDHMTIYSEGQVFYKDVYFPSQNVAGHFVDTILFSDKLFNGDAKIEFLYIFQSTNTSEQVNNLRRMYLMNEDGEIIQDFGLCQYAAVIKDIYGNYKLVTLHLGIKNVYSLSGELAADQQILVSKNLIAYPNPAEDDVFISGFDSENTDTIGSIFDIAGQEVKQVEIKNNDTVEIDISSFAKGTYFFKLEGKVIKLIKK